MVNSLQNALSKCCITNLTMRQFTAAMYLGFQVVYGLLRPCRNAAKLAKQTVDAFYPARVSGWLALNI